MNNKRMKSLEERDGILETDVVTIREMNKEFLEMHRDEGEINQRHIDLFEDIAQHIEWLNSAIALLSFTTAGLVIGLIGSHAKMASLRKMMNEG